MSMLTRSLTAIVAITVFLAGALTLSGLSPRASAGPPAVSNADDSGAGSLRQAILDANGNAGHDIIDFDPSVSTISPATALPASTDPAGVTIDGAGAGVIIDGSAAASTPVGLLFHTSTGVDLGDVIVRSLTVQNFSGGGIHICGGDLGSCADDVTGTRIGSADVLDNGEDGILVRGGNVNDTELDDCTVSGNTSAGIYIEAGQQLDSASIRACQSSDNGTQAIRLRGTAGISGTSITAVTTFNAANDGLYMRSTSGDVTDTIIDDYSASNVATGLHLDADGSVTGATVTNATLNDNHTGIKIEAANTDISDIALSGIEANRSSSHGMLVNAGGTISSFSISDCNANDNGDKGIQVKGPGGVSGFAISACSASRNTNHGINVSVPGGGGDLTGLSLTNVKANDNGDHGINPNSGGSEMLNLTIDNTEASGNKQDGIYANGGGGNIVDALYRTSSRAAMCSTASTSVLLPQL